MIDIHTILKKKTELLCKGIFLDDTLIDHYKSQGIEIEYGRKGGAGPLGGRYFLFEDEKTLVNVALWNDPKRTNLVLKEMKDGYFSVYDKRERGHFCKLKLVKNPEYYAEGYETSDGTPMKKVALVHGVDCLATTIYQKCKYWACGEACKFCGIELSLKQGSTILEKTAEQIIEVIAQAKKEGRCSHMTLTSGTSGEAKGAKRYIDLLKGIRKEYPDLPLHIQIEPMEDFSYVAKLKKAGADTIGVHLEILDDFLRKIITPGKAKIPMDYFKKCWKQCIEIFGKNQVESFILTGFGESPEDLIGELEEVIKIGVIPFITPVRAIPSVKSSLPIMNHNTLLEIYSRAAKLMKEHGVNPLEHKAGCVRCGGCSAISEAYKAAP